MNNCLSGVIFWCEKGTFMAETVMQSRRLPVLDMFVSIRHNCAFQ